MQSIEELDKVFDFTIGIFGDLSHTMHTREHYREVYLSSPSLLIWAERDGQEVGSVFGTVEGDHILISLVAVDPRARRLGIGQAMMEREEAAGLALGYHAFILGARQDAEPFYLSCGYTPNLFIQVFAPGKLEEMKRLNPGYPVIWEDDSEGLSKLMIRPPAIDRELQAAYDRVYPGCGTQYVFTKERR